MRRTVTCDNLAEPKPRDPGATPIGFDINANGTITANAPRKTFGQAAGQIIVADVSMSLDNVLAVAGAAREHPLVLIFGLGLSISLMGVAASFTARLLQNHRWIAYVGLAVIHYVARCSPNAPFAKLEALTAERP